MRTKHKFFAIGIILVVLTVFCATQLQAQEEKEEVSLEEFLNRLWEDVRDLQVAVKTIAEVAVEKGEVRALETRVAALETTVSAIGAPQDTPTPQPKSTLVPSVTPTAAPVATPTEDPYDYGWCPRGTQGHVELIPILKPVPNAEGEIDLEDELRYEATVLFHKDGWWLGCYGELMRKKESYVEEFMALLREVSTYCNLSPGEVALRVRADASAQYRRNGYQPDIAIIDGVPQYVMMHGVYLQDWTDNKESRCPQSAQTSE